MSQSRLKVTVEDLDTGEVETSVLEDDWTVDTGDPWEIAACQVYGNGTTQLTIKKAVPAARTEPGE